MSGWPCQNCGKDVPRHELPAYENRKLGLFCDTCLREGTPAPGSKESLQRLVDREGKL